MKVKYVKWIAVMLVLSLSVALFAGCNAKKSDKDEQGRTVISVGDYPTQEGSSKDKFDKRIATFEEKNPDIKIEPSNWSFDLKTFYAKAAGGQLPTVFKTHFTETAQMIDSEYSADITEGLEKAGLLDKFNERILDIVSDENGKVYAYPVSSYVLGMVCNTEHFEKAGLMEADGTPKQPKTWDEVVEFAVKLKNVTGKPGFIFPTANNSGGWIFTCLAWSFGAEFMKQEEDGTWTAIFDSPEAAEALQWIKDLKWKYDVLPSNTLIDGTEYYKVFGTDGASMLIGGGDVPKQFVPYGMNPEQIGMFAIPAGPKKHVTLLGGDEYSVDYNATEDQIDAAIKWVRNMYDCEVTDTYRQNQKNQLQTYLEENRLVGVKSLSVWNENATNVQYLNNLIDEMTNVNPNHVRLYNEFVQNLPCEIRPEEPICAQELYGVLDSCIQAVLTDENADCAALLKKANADFQTNYLDNLTY